MLALLTGCLLAQPAPNLAAQEFDRGLDLVEQGSPAGLHWLARAVHDAPTKPAYRQAFACYLRSFPRLLAEVDDKVTGDGVMFFRHGDLYQTETQQKVSTLKDCGQVDLLAFGAGYRQVVTVSGDQLRFWEVSSGKPLGTLSVGQKVARMRFSPNGSLLATAGDQGRVDIWQVADRQRLASIQLDSPPTCLSFDTTGYLLLTGGSQLPLALWDNRGRPRWTVDLESAGSVSFKSDGQTILVTRGPEVRLLAVSDGSEQDTPIRHPDDVLASCWGPDGQLVTLCRDAQVRLWDLPANECRTLGLGETADGLDQGSLAFDASGTRLLACWPGGARYWSGEDFERASPLFSGGSAAFFTGRERAVIFGHTLRLWDLPPRPLAVVGDLVNQAWWAADGRLVTRSRNQVEFWNPTTWERVGPPLKLDGVTLAALSLDGHAMAMTDGFQLGVWDVDSGKSGPLQDFTELRWLEFSPDGQSLGCSHFQPELRDPHTAAPKLALEQTVWTHSNTFNGDRLAAVADSKLLVWDCRSGKLVLQQDAHLKSARVVEFSPDGKLLLTGGEPGQAALWEASTGKAKAAMAHSAAVRLACFSPDGKTILTVASGGTGRFWSSEGQPLGLPFSTPESPDDAVFVDCSTVLFDHGYRGVQLWDVETTRPISPRIPGLTRDSLKVGRWRQYRPVDPQARLLVHATNQQAEIWPLSGDQDEPVELCELEAQLWTGTRLDGDGRLLPLDVRENLASRWRSAAEAHAQTCQYRQANLWVGPSARLW